MILYNICNISAMDISELQWHVKQEKQELIKAEEKLDYASTINKAGFVNVRSLNISHKTNSETNLSDSRPTLISIKSIRHLLKKN